MFKAKIKKIKQQKAEHFNPNGESVGFLSHDENLYLRTQIRRYQESGWYLMFKGEKIIINEHGYMKYPQPLYYKTTDLLNELFGI